MRIALFGATGRTGSAVLERALLRDHDVVALTRSLERLPETDGLTRILGDATDPEAVRSVLEGTQAVISALGARTPDTAELSDATAGVIGGCEQAGVRRIAIVSQVGVFLSKTRPEFAHVREEHLRNLSMLRASSLAWTALAPAGIDDRSGDGAYTAVVDARAPEWQISRFDLADALLDAIERDEWIGHAVGVSDAVDVA
jgi:putative NADH-flavin reductase